MNESGSADALLALRELLLEVAANPSRFSSSQIASSLKSQAALAALSLPERGIRGVSLNTLKRKSLTSVGGFDAIDRLRRGALEAMDKHRSLLKQSGKTTKTGLTKRVKELESDLQVAREDLLLITHLLDKALTQGRDYASRSRNETIAALCLREQSELRDMLTLRRTSFALKLVRG